MSNLFVGLNIGRSALVTQQTALDVVGHNLANAQTDGYSRQRAEVVQGVPLQSPAGSIGTGTDVATVQRIQAGYLERQIGQTVAQNGYDNSLVQGLETLQTVLGEPSSEGLSNAMTDFWNSWESLSASPTDSGLRAQVLNSAENLATVYNDKIQGLQDAEVGFEQNLSDAVSDVNSMAQKMATLNESIAKTEASGHTANDLRDQRDLLVRQISEKIGVEVETDGEYVNLKLQGENAYLVNRGDSFTISASAPGSGDMSTLQMENLKLTPSGGEIGALMKLRNELAPGLGSELSTLVATVVDRVNDLHAQGYDAYGPSGRNLFTWTGEATTSAFAPSTGLVSASGNAALEPGTHHVDVASVDGLVPNDRGTDGGAITLSEAGTYTGSLALNQDYYVKVSAANSNPGELDGLQVQLFRADEAVGDVKTLTDPGSGPATVSWSGVDGLDFSAQISLVSGQSIALGQRSNGLSTTGSISLDGGPPQTVTAVDGARVTLTGGGGSGFTAGGSADILLSDRVFSGATFTRYGPQGQLAVDPEVSLDENRIAAGAAGPDGSAPSAGDGEMARRIADLASQSIFEDLGETPAGYLARTVQTLGGEARDAQVAQSASNSVLTQLDAQQQSTSGVNIDEEMVQLLQNQRGFQAAARFLTTVDGMIDTLVNHVGVV